MTPDEIAKLPYRPNVGVMLINRDGGVFVGQRRDRYEDAWQMPQGGIDRGEDAYEAALRELEEETGVSRDLVELVAETGAALLLVTHSEANSDTNEVLAKAASHEENTCAK